MEVKGIKHEMIKLFGHEFEAKVNFNTITLTTLESKAVHVSSRDGYASVSITFDTPNQIETGETYEDGWVDGWNARVAPKPTDEEAQSDDYRQAAEYWQRMYEQTFAERTCQIDYERHCSNCGVFIRDEAVLVRKDLDDGAWTVVPKPINYCPNCGAKVVSE